MMFALVVFKRRRWLRSRKLADKYVAHARLLLPSQDPADVNAAISLLDAALKLSPQWEKALELKARALLSMRRFKEVASMLFDYIPSMKTNFDTPPDSPLFGKEKAQLLTSYLHEEKSKRKSMMKFAAISKIRKIFLSGFSKRSERNEWRYHILGQACCHLGMMEDAIILLQSGKKAANAAFRRESNCMGEDTFCSDAFAGPESDFVTHLLGNIKFLLRRRSAALAAMEAGLYTEAVRHFSKILDGRRGTPQGFIAECYLHRALAFKAAGRVADAIADCNRTIVLDPSNAEAYSTRASLYEMVRCFYEGLQDLRHVRELYEALQHQQKLPLTVHRHYQASYVDVSATLYQLDLRMEAVKQRLDSRYTIDYHTILGLSPGCTKTEVERAHLLICLKHRPDKAAHFVDRCEYVDDRDIDTVKEEARLAANRLFHLIQNAQSSVLHIVVEEDMERRKRALRSSPRGSPLRSEAGKDIKSLSVLQNEKLNLLVSNADDRKRVWQNSTLSEIVEDLDGYSSTDVMNEKERHDIVILEALPSRSDQVNTNGNGTFDHEPLACCTGSSYEHQYLESSDTESNRNAHYSESGLPRDEDERQILIIHSTPIISTSSFVSEAGSSEGECSSHSGSESEETASSTNPFTPVPLCILSSTVSDDANGTCSSIFSTCGLEESAGSSTAACREVIAVELQLASVLSPSTWITSKESWAFQNHSALPVQVT